MTIELNEAIEILERTPSALRSLLGGLGDGWTSCREETGSWSPHGVLGHLIVGEESDWIPRAEIILEQGQKRPFDTFDREAQFKGGYDGTIDELLDRFLSIRQRNLSKLRAMELTPELLTHRGRHPVLGTVTLSELIATWVAHDLTHLSQLGRIMAKRWQAEVGPWNRPGYLSIMNRSHEVAQSGS